MYLMLEWWFILRLQNIKYGRCLNLFSVLLSEYGQRKHLTRRLTRTLNQDKSTRLGCSIVVANRLIFFFWAVKIKGRV